MLLTRLVRTRRSVMLNPRYLTTNQSEECPWADHTLLHEHSSWILSRMGNTILRALARYGPLCLAKQESYFFSMSPQTLVSVFLCCASEQRLGFCSTINWTHGVLPTQWFWGAWAVRYKRQIQFFLSGNSPCMAFPAVPPSHHILPGNFSAVMTKWVIKSSCYFPFQFI